MGNSGDGSGLDGSYSQGFLLNSEVIFVGNLSGGKLAVQVRAREVSKSRN